MFNFHNGDPIHYVFVVVLIAAMVQGATYVPIPYTHVPIPPAAPNVTSCPYDMVNIGGKFCIDRYEAPNVKGWRPLAFQSGIDAEYWCHEKQRDLCTEIQWDRACGGPDKLPYPYGTVYNVSACNANKTWIPVNWTAMNLYPQPIAFEEAARLYQADKSGANEGCVSAEGAYDLTGNVCEWVRRDYYHEDDPYNHVMKGCYWAGCYGGEPASCGFTNPAHPAKFREYPAGFRCCVWLQA